jgi:ribulose-phosphate 3-epimerase
MIERPERHVADFAKAGADVISIHHEATPHVSYALKAVREAGCKAGLALTPATPPEVAVDVVDELDVLLCMTVNPGWGGQAFIEHSLRKLPRIRQIVGPDKIIEVDGGIDARTAPGCAEAGANWFVAGSAVFGSGDPAKAYLEIARSIGEKS